VLAGELRSLHDVLHRPPEALEEAVLEAILATMAEALRHLGDLVACGRDPSPMLTKDLADVRRLAAEICSDCVPIEHAPELKVWMDRVQELGERLEGSAGSAETK
jgi:hypothetical protein